jgi:D-glycero-D-manno-heptose 1,7-bisphosphate phosphatase
MKRAVFLDRDGVITPEPPQYAYKISQLAFIPKAADAIRLLNENGFLVVIVSNQAGIAYGYYREEDAELFNKAMVERLAQEDARIDAVYYCPHHAEAKVERYRRDCDCRKPEPGMLKRAEKELEIDMKQSFMIGDKQSDIEAGQRAGCKTIMVETGRGAGELRNKRVRCDYIAADLYHAVMRILDLTGEPGKISGTMARRGTLTQRNSQERQKGVRIWNES